VNGNMLQSSCSVMLLIFQPKVKFHLLLKLQ